jgi:hypothetical protein
MRDFLNDTVELLREKQVAALSSVAASSWVADELTKEVEFWKWMGRNYSNDFGSVESIMRAAEEKPFWTRLQLQGKGYEWDWMTRQRGLIENLFSRFEAGDDPTAAGTDITKTNLLSGEIETFQNKAYVSGAVPDVHNTPYSATVVTNEENARALTGRGRKVKIYGDANEIMGSVEKRLLSAKSGTAKLSYDLQTVSASAAKAGLIGVVIGAGAETLASHRRWNDGELTDDEYAAEILRSGGNGGAVAAATHCVMIPVKATFAVAGVSGVLSFPIAIAVGGALNHIIAPLFRRGAYRKALETARYYRNLNMFHRDFTARAAEAANDFEGFLYEAVGQKYVFEKLKRTDAAVTAQLTDLYEKISEKNILQKEDLRRLSK